ncbi:MAG TPA: hypothetical protein VML00_03000 [Bacteroidota bacterium]|nr:hypothetical protein [Bacteroidota bacterium]
MKRKSVWLASLALAGLLLFSESAMAGVWVGIRLGPPPPRREVVVASPGPGWVWARGHWGWYNARYRWVPGRWMAPRAGHRWVDGRWYHRHDGWAYREGHWHGRR